MNKIEFSDVNRFLASLGLISIGLAFFIPWIVNQNNSFVSIEQEKINKLTITAQKIITKQQDTLLSINNSIPYISLGLIILGVALLVYGIYNWRKRQSVLDKIQDEELISKEIQNLSSQEKRDLIANEIDNSEDTEQNEERILNNSNADERKLEIESYIQIENSIYLQLSEHYKFNFKASQNVKIGEFNYDIILKSKDTQKFRDKIIEIKFYKSRLSFETIKEAALKLIESCNKYERNFARRTYPHLIVIYNEVEFDEQIKKYKSELENFGKELGKPLKLKFLEKKQVATSKAVDYFA